MNRVLIALVVLGLVVLPASDASAQKSFWKQVAGALVPEISVNTRQFGFDLRGARMTVVNGTPFFGKVFASSKEVARLGPADIARDARNWDLMSSVEIPIAVLLYEDAAMTRYLGAAGRIFSFSGGTSTSLSWTFELGHFIGPNGQQVAPQYGGQIYPAPDVKLASKGVEFPKEWWSGTTGVQIVNNSFFTMDLRVDGRILKSIAPTSIDHFNARDIDLGRNGEVMTLQIIFTDRGRFIGTQEQPFYVPSSDVRAAQMIFGPYSIRR